MLNNVDVSIINVLQTRYPDIFNQYFNRFGIIPNPNLDTRNKAKGIFRNYSSENFENFIQRYRNLVWTFQKSNEKKSSNVSPYQVLETPKEKFKIINFIIKKIKKQDYIALELQSEEGLQEVVTNLNYSQSSSEILKNMFDYITAFNKINKYEVLSIYD